MNEWQDQIRQAFRHFQQFSDYAQNKVNLNSYQAVEEYPFFLPPFWAEHLLQKNSPALWKQFLPQEKEIAVEGGLLDPIGDQTHQKTTQLIHRYKNRVLLAPTTVCPVNCRYCFRKNELLGGDKIFQVQLNESLNYIKNHSEIDEVILTGGDPFMLSDDKIESYLQALSLLSHVKFVRFHTRMPVIIPQRLSRPLLEVFRKFEDRFSRLLVVVHMNHADEWSQELELQLKFFQRAGIEFLSQTVLLKGVNDSIDQLYSLFHLLSSKKISPYYLHHPDQTKGAMHFTLSIEEGRRLYAQLQDKLPGWAIPKYVLDIPHGGGKTPIFNPEKFEYSGSLINKEAKEVKVILASENSSYYN